MSIGSVSLVLLLIFYEVLYFIVLYCIVLYCIVLNCNCNNNKYYDNTNISDLFYII